MRRLTRGGILAFLVLAYAAGMLVQQGAAAQQPGANQPPAPLPNLIKVRDDVYVIQNQNHLVSEIGQNGGNVTIYVTNEGVILVDSKFERMHDDIIAKVKSVTNQPIRYMILTHSHGDHSGGSARLQALGVNVVSSVGTRQNMARTNAPGAAHVTFDGYGQMFLGGKELQLREYRGHTRGDTLISLPAARIAIGGDLVTTPDTIPTIVNYADGGNWTDLGRSLDEIANFDFDVMIGGHGPNLTKAEFLKYRDKVNAIRERFRTLNRERPQKSAEEITQTLIKEFNWGTGPAAGNVAGMMLELR